MIRKGMTRCGRKRGNPMKRRTFLQGSAALAALGTSGILSGCATARPRPPRGVSASGQSWAKDALAHGQMAKSGQMSPLQQAELAIARAKRLNAPLNFLVTPTFEQARARAAGPLPDGPFSGVPVLTKDLTDTKGVRTAYGSRALVNYVPKKDAGIYTAMLAQGMVSIGKSATPEFGFLPTTEPLAFGPTRNPWNLEHSTGGSSGGSAAAVAAGVVPMAQASDGGGSIRIPSNCCALFGMKASRGRWPDADGTPWELSVRGFVTRTVRDSQTAMAVIAGDAGGKLPSPVLPPEERGKKYRIGFTTHNAWGRPVHPDCAAAVHRAAEICEDLGHTVEEHTIAYSADAFNTAFMTLWSFGARQAVETVTKVLGRKPARDELEPLTWWLYDKVKDKDPAVLEDVYKQFARERDAARAFFKDFDFHLTPVLGAPAVKIGQINQFGDLDAEGERFKDYVAFTPYANATGHPAMAVPMAWTAENVPVGVQFEGAYGNEANLFELAYQIEKAAPWAQYWPDIALS